MNFVNDGWIRKALEYDKLAHAGGSCLAVCLLWLVLSVFNTNLFTVSCIVLSGGIALELWQGFYGHGFSWRDLVANVVGVLIAHGAIGG